MGLKVSTEIRDVRLKFRNKDKNYRELLQKDPMIQELYRKERGISSTPSSATESTVVEQITYDEAFFNRYDDVETVKKLLFSVSKEADKFYDSSEPDIEDRTTSFPLKLYIAEPTQDYKNFMTKFAVRNKIVGLFGLTHAGLQIGDKMVHFFDNSFVKIDQFKSKQALLLLSISQSGRLPNDDKLKTIIAQVIVEWNKFYMYDEKFSNCQDFVEYLVKQVSSFPLTENDKLSLSFEHNKIIRDYMKLIRTAPLKSGFVFYSKSKSLTRPKREGEENSSPQSENQDYIEFECHSDLDEWEQENKDKLSKDELAFLKGFHRAFQLRYAAAEMENDFTASKRFEESPYGGCTRGNATII